MLKSSEASVNSALQRARATTASRIPGPDRERAPLPRSAPGTGRRDPVRHRVCRP